MAVLGKLVLTLGRLVALARTRVSGVPFATALVKLDLPSLGLLAPALLLSAGGVFAVTLGGDLRLAAALAQAREPA